jgi:hypothetical protein
MARGWSHQVIARPGWTALGVYAVTTLLFALIAPSSLWTSHTAFNHFALLADCWLDGRLGLAGKPPSYAAGNDFAYAFQRWFIVFPGFPAVLLLPVVWLLGGAEHVADGAVFLLLAGLAPSGLYLTLHRIQRAKITELSPAAMLVWPVLYAVGSVYFFTAVQGTVWFAAHVVTAIATCFFLWASIEAKRPFVAGLMLSAVFATRTPLVCLGAFFCFEFYRMTFKTSTSVRIDTVATLRRLAWFGLPVVVTGALLALNNYERFGEFTEFGYRYLTVAWQTRIEQWGLLGYHYLARNLGILLSSLPYVTHGAEGVSFQINGHGLALWVTSPFYLWLLWPKQRTVLHRALYVTLPLVMWPSLFYQNSGWLQFGQRFSNDYAPLLFVLLALGGYAWSRLFKAACVWAVLVNTFGAVTFGRSEYNRFYFIERSQKVIYQPD